MPSTVTEYSTQQTGQLVETGKYRNLTGLPIHYTDGEAGLYSMYGSGIVADLIPIVDEISIFRNE